MRMNHLKVYNFVTTEYKIIKIILAGMPAAKDVSLNFLNFSVVMFLNLIKYIEFVQIILCLDVNVCMVNMVNLYTSIPLI